MRFFHVFAQTTHVVAAPHGFACVVILKDLDYGELAELWRGWSHHWVDVIDPLSYLAGWRN